MLKLKSLLATLILLTSLNTNAQTLNVGDIAIIGYHSDSPDQFVWIALTDIPAGEIIYFTEKGWDANLNTWFANSEGHCEWTSPAGGISCGTIIHIQYGGGAFFTTGGGSTAIADGGWSLIGGDQLMAYRGGSLHEPVSPVFLHGINCDYNALDYNATTTWNDGASNTSSFPSMLPSGLTNGVNCISIFPAPGPEFDNDRYTGTLTGTPASVFASINNASNWNAESDATIPMDASQFATPSITCAPSCTDPDIPIALATPATVCPSSSATLTWTGNLNDAAEWHIYSTACGVGQIGTTTSNSFVVSPGMTTTYYIRGEDGAGCVDEAIGLCGSVTVNATDATFPTASNPAGINVECISDVPAPDVLIVTDEADNCGIPVVTWAGDVSDGGSCPEIITRTYHVEDPSGNGIDAFQTITVGDATNPTASNPATINVECIADVPAPDILAVTDEADNCSAAPVVAFVSDVSDGLSCPETITRTYSVTDDCGNSINVTHIIVVNDITNPTASNPPSINVECIADVPASDILVVTDEADNCTANPIVAFVSDVSDGLSCPETITRTYSVTDDCGNSINVVQTIVVNDITNPAASNPATINVECIADVPASDILVVTDETDNCTANPVVAFVSDVSDGLSCPETITRTYSVTDDCGNSITVTQLIIVSDVTNPSASNPTPINVECPTLVPAPDVTVVTDETDNCTASPIVTWVSDVSDGLSCPETITRTYNVFDDCGNSISVTQIITINDLTSPTPNDPTLSDINSECEVTPTAPTASDNCSGFLTATPDVAFPITTTGTTTVTWTYTDDCGNTANQTQDVIITPIDVSTTTNLFIDDQYEIVANASGYSYQWIEDCGGTNTVITGATSIDYVPSTNGIYAVILDNGTCADTSDCVVIDDLGIEMNDFGSDLKIYPNPTFGDLKIDLGAEYNDIDVSVYNASGQIIIDKNFKSTNEIDLKFAASPGMYVLEIRTDEGKSTRVNIIKK